jgi:hypothetical protein
MKALGFGLILFLFFIPVSSQFYQYGEEPGSVKWKKIESEHFVIVYPEGNKEIAEKMMNLFEISYNGNSDQLNYSPKKIPVLLHFQTVVSNGFVVWAPKRVELFMHPDVDGYSQEWHNQLALHEYRHVVQVEKLNKGVSKILTTVLGQQGIGPAVGMIPFWFIEGDAVYAETSLSQSGRGRLPSFEMELKAQLLTAEKRYSYDKAYLGSYKDFVPDYYRLGYQMVSYARKNYSNDIWTGALDHIGRNPYQLAPMYFFLRKYDLSGKKLYNNTMTFLKENWTESVENRKIENIPWFENRTNDKYTSYNYPQCLDDGSVIAIKSSLDQIDQFVRIYPDGQEKKVYTPGYLYSHSISLSGNKIVWDEQVPHVRYRNKSFSVIKMLDIKTGKLKKLSHSSRFSSPSYSDDNKLIVAIETSTEIDFNLVFISTEGEIVHVAKSPENVQLMQPSWVPGRQKVLLISLGPEGKSLMEYDLENHIWTNLLNTGPVNISNPVSDGNKIYFNASWNGSDNIYSLDPADGIIHQLSYSKFGAFEPFVDQNTKSICYSDYSDDGYHIIKRAFNDLTLIELKKDKEIKEQAFFNYTDNHKLKEFGSHSEIKNYDEKNYTRLRHMFNIHSWAPVYFDYNNPAIDDIKLNPGFTLLSQNLLGTAISSLGYEYKDQDHYIHANFTYSGFFPIISIDYDFGGFPAIGTTDTSIQLPPKVNTNANIGASMYLPLNLSRGKWNIGFTPSMKINFSGTYLYSLVDSVYNRGLTSLEGRVFSYIFLKTAYRDLQPRWGLVFDGSFLSAPFEKEHFGDISSFQTSIYLPGLFKNQGIKARYYKQWNNPKIFLFSNNKIPFVRGINSQLGLDMQRFSVDYNFPLAYPDLSLGSLIYLKRIRTDLFSDYLEGDIINFEASRIEPKSFQTTGIEMYFDFHAFRFLFPFNLGVRYSYFHQEASYRLECLFSIDINKF